MGREPTISKAKICTKVKQTDTNNNNCTSTKSAPSTGCPKQNNGMKEDQLAQDTHNHCTHQRNNIPNHCHLNEMHATMLVVSNNNNAETENIIHKPSRQQSQQHYPSSGGQLTSAANKPPAAPVAACQATGAARRPIDELRKLIQDFRFERTSLTNDELISLVKHHMVSIYKLESFLGKDNAARCVEIRRDYYRAELAELDKIDQLGITDRAEALGQRRYEDLDYDRVNGACCENVIGHVKVPVGLAGPLVLDGEEIFVPLATTEGCLVASTCRGLSALRKGGGVTSRVRRDFMTRAPIVRFQDPNLRDALNNVERAIAWLNNKNNKEKMCAAFNLTSSHGRFLNYTMYPVNREIHIRFEAQTGDAMGMNMCSKGVESALKEMQRAFPTMEIVTLSGNMCTDKKAAGINWINGRGKSVECNAELPAHVVQQVFKVTVDQLVDRWKSKVMIGSALAASIGGFNSQAANILTAIFIATGQDPAQNVTSSNCMLILEKDSKGSLVVCCTMPSIECGTVGGGTILGDQSRYLQMMGVRGPTPRQASSHAQKSPPETDHQQQANGSLHPRHVFEGGVVVNSNNEYTNARKLARIVCATVMAGELSLLAALTEGTLVKSHMRHNRSSTNVVSGGAGSVVMQANKTSNSTTAGASCFGPLVNPGFLHQTTAVNYDHCNNHTQAIVYQELPNNGNSRTLDNHDATIPERSTLMIHNNVHDYAGVSQDARSISPQVTVSGHSLAGSSGGVGGSVIDSVSSSNLAAVDSRSAGGVGSGFDNVC